MWIQLLVLLLGLLGLLACGDSNGRTDNRVRRNYLIFICIILILQSALRNVAVGADTFEYNRRFDYYSTLSWAEHWQNFIDATFNGIGKDAGYDVFNKAISCISGDFQFFLLVVAAFFFTVLGKFVYRNTSTTFDVFMVLCFYELFFYTFFSITGIRQTIAVGLCLWSYKYIEEREIIPFVLLVLVASTFHKTSLIFLPFYFLYRVKIGRTILLCSFIALPFLMMAARSFAIFLADLMGDYSVYANSTYATAGGPNYLIMLLMLALVCFFKFNMIQSIDGGRNVPYVNALAVTIALAPLVWIDPTLLRLSYYYSIFILGLFPGVIRCFYRKNDYKSQWFMALLILAVFGFIIIKTNSNYAFFWQEMELGENYYRR